MEPESPQSSSYEKEAPPESPVEFAFSAVGKGWEWFSRVGHGAYGQVVLFTLSFTESIFFIIPPDPLLMAILLTGSQRWVYFGMLTTVASVLGAIVGYVIAYGFFSVIGDPVIAFYGLEEEFSLVQGYFDRNTFGVMLFAAFTPIPYKLFVLTAGFLKVNFLWFVLASIIGRGARYMLIAWGTHMFGTAAITFIRTYTPLVTIASFVLFALYVIYIFVLG